MSPSMNNVRSRQTQPAPRSRMSALFNTIRASIYGSVLLFTVICLAMAGHFQTVLAASDLTRFIPFAIFVCSASFFIFMVLISFGVFLRERNPISTRIELASLGLAGVFWLVLGVYLTTSESQSADVECFASSDATQPLSDEAASFHTDQYQAMYRVLNSFSLINAALILFSCLTLLFLAARRHRNGDKHMWHGPVTSCTWFNDYGHEKRATKGRTGNSNLLPLTTGEYTEKRPDRVRSARRGNSTRHQHGPKNPNIPPKTYPSATPDNHRRHGTGNTSPRSNESHEFDNGGMNNPYRTARRTR
ncbi:hypothetical protein K443DRAFT_247083 [Laccaria amethystina LaAM-08-1]|uniref:MARVEL domain-containing protein n=1 Tax=Laccaria amethystina LaAM-08-1 TaxID=1095629 RepID=A0A0C9Y8X3_9AGAR|nr:hypothetical protein K443DRAFT_247083 [Laccaria amethystina LaAM-08-1]